MKTGLVGSMIVLGAASLTASAEEFSWGNVVVQPRAYVGYADYSLESGDMTYVRQNAPPQTRPLQFDAYNNSKIDFRRHRSESFCQSAPSSSRAPAAAVLKSNSVP